ncbi:MAG: sulfite exporter TauE/SafE family protein [Rhodothermales bacterium]
MAWTSLLFLVGAGLAGGFIAGLIGVGGGIIFAPVLFFYFQSTGVAADVVTPLTLGTSLLCTLVAALASAVFQYQERTIDVRIAVMVGLFSAVAVQLVTRFVTTEPWYNGTAFQVVFGLVLTVVAIRMAWPNQAKPNVPERTSGKKKSSHPRWASLAVTGAAAGAISAAAGVGGGVVLVPAYTGLLRLPMHRAVGTSSATIVFIAMAGVIGYAVTGWDVPMAGLTLGYVDVRQALVLSVPAALSARLGVAVAHRIDTRVLKWCFAALAAFVAARLLLAPLW